MLEYTIIGILLFAWAWQTWRKHVWKKRAKNHYVGFWGVVQKNMENSVPQRRDWPELLDEK